MEGRGWGRGWEVEGGGGRGWEVEGRGWEGRGGMANSNCGPVDLEGAGPGHCYDIHTEMIPPHICAHTHHTSARTLTHRLHKYPFCKSDSGTFHFNCIGSHVSLCPCGSVHQTEGI